MCFKVIEDPAAKPNEILHACDLLCMRRLKRKRDEEKAKATRADAAKQQVAQMPEADFRQRLDSTLADLHQDAQSQGRRIGSRFADSPLPTPRHSVFGRLAVEPKRRRHRTNRK